MKPIIKGSIVKFGNGWFRVKSKFSTTVNLCGIFSGKITHKKVLLSDVTEDEEAWYKNWQQSETYQSM